MSLRRNRVKQYYLRKLTVATDLSGYNIKAYGEAVPFSAEIYPASGQMQMQIYGLRLLYMKNMLFDPFDKDNIGIEIKENDRICVDVPPDADPDYKVVAVNKYSRHYRYDIERVID